ncbi:MAG: zinc ABC transporter substrate-binding protein [Akkermansia sp.]|nr:zinc ABC transporter substrate-binding protein [Akkermansia sp.]MBR5875569.1 zinc ABC transporter substrate-binding protein [Akkermansia sp.]
MKTIWCFVLMLFGLGAAQAAELKIASLHPLLSEMARNIGGEAVEVVDLFPANGDLHSFAPGSKQMAAAANADMLLACGKGIEPYLAELAESMPEDTVILGLGRDIPNVYLPNSRRADPHWWNTPENMKRASRTLLATLSQLAPAQQATFTAGQKKYAATMDALTRKARLQFSRIPQNRRYLVTGHAAMCHFCEEFGFTPITIHGISKESEGDTATLAALLNDLRAKDVRCIFTEVGASPKILEVIAEQLGVPTAPLVLDGVFPGQQSYEKLFMHNVNTISKHLK